MFQEEIARGKKLFMYLFVLNFISRKTLNKELLKKGRCLEGSLSLG